MDLKQQAADLAAKTGITLGDGEIDIQFLDRRPDLVQPGLSPDLATRLTIAAALAEDDARRSRRPTVADGRNESSIWLERARLEGLR